MLLEAYTALALARKAPKAIVVRVKFSTLAENISLLLRLLVIYSFFYKKNAEQSLSTKYVPKIVVTCS